VFKGLITPRFLMKYRNIQVHLYGNPCLITTQWGHTVGMEDISGTEWMWI